MQPKIYSDIQRLDAHPNAFGVLRLLFASLVIVAHTPELHDGNRSRELLTTVFGTLSFGELAVDGFFLVSGYLIAGSFLSRPQTSAYLIKRVARIYPAFCIASLLCVVFVAPLAGATPADMLASLGENLWAMIWLHQPKTPGVFAGTPYAVLNGAVWTINYEFRCYLLVLALGLTQILNRPLAVFALAALCLAAFESHVLHHFSPDFRLMGVFLAGVLFFLLRDKIRYTIGRFWIAFVLAAACLRFPVLAEPGLALFGGYCIFAIAELGAGWRIAKINNRDDISYGVYLYAWPIEKLIFWWFPATPLLAAATATFLIACAFGWLSWHGVEKRVMQAIRRLDSHRASGAFDSIPSAPAAHEAPSP